MTSGCGYTPQEIDSLTLPQVLDQFDYWKSYPPIHELVAAYFGYPKDKTASQNTDAAMAAMLDASGGKIVRNLRG